MRITPWPIVAVAARPILDGVYDRLLPPRWDAVERWTAPLASSVRAYSPRLTAMSFYDVVGPVDCAVPVPN